MSRIPREFGGAVVFLVIFAWIGAIVVGFTLAVWWAVGIALAAAAIGLLVAVLLARSPARAHPPQSDAPHVTSLNVTS